MSDLRTVVFQVTDKDEFEKLWGSLCDSMRDQNKVNGAIVIGLSLDDVMGKLEKMEEKEFFNETK